MLEVIKKNISKAKETSHAFLIGNVSFLNVKEELDDLINSIYFQDNKSIYQNPDVIIINEEELENIKKEEILLMQKRVSKTAQFNKNKVYIIINCENLNISSSNSLLKLLEEPEENIYAFLLTKNINKILPTIKSRCKNYFVSSDIERCNIYKTYSNTDIKKFIEVVNKIENSKQSAYLINNKDFKDKDKIKNIIKMMFMFYKDCLNYLNDMKIEYFINEIEEIKEVSKLNNVNIILNKLLIINDIINDLNYNLNVSLSFDKLVIEFWRLK